MSKLALPLGALQYVMITGEGKNNAMKGEEPSMQFVASVKYHKDSTELSELKAKLTTIWDEYKTTEHSAKGTLSYGRLSKCAGVKPITVEVEDKSDIDPETEKVRRVETDYVMVSAKTNVAWPDGNLKVVDVYANQKDASGKIYAGKVTDKINAAAWTIGNDSTGILHLEVKGNTIGGKAKLTFYLQAVQLVKLIKYTGGDVEVVATPEEETDFGEDEIATTEEMPEV